MGENKGHSTPIPAFEQDKTEPGMESCVWGVCLKDFSFPSGHWVPQATLFVQGPVWSPVRGSALAPRAPGLACPPALAPVSMRQHHQWSRGCESSLINTLGRA